MSMHSNRSRLLAATIAGALIIGALAIASLRSGKAEAQGVMSAPACQCSLPTPIPSLSTQVVHCLCGGMSCVVTEHTGPGKSTNLLQCVK